jgi:8-oxo-dGTP diphosphatase
MTESTLVRCSGLVWGPGRDQVLLVRRRDGDGEHYALPGGAPHPGETLAACARREAREETGLAVNAVRVA